MEERALGPRALLSAMLERRLDPYEGGDLGQSRHVAVGLLGVTVIVCLGYLPLEPVSDQLGWPGWAIAGLTLAAGLVATVILGRRPPGWQGLLRVGYGAIFGIGVLNWLAGQGTSAYADLFVLWAGASSMHPPRRAFPMLGAMIALLWVPYAAGDAPGLLVGNLIASSLLIAVIGFVLGAVMFGIRRQRVTHALSSRLARVDPLTGLGNRRAFDEMLTLELARRAREGAPLSVAIADLDDLKRINDLHGHLEGDRCLREAARALELSVRVTDSCFRWGGDEFVILLPGSDHEASTDVLVRMVESVAASCKTVDDQPLRLTFGVAEFETDATTEQVLALADLSLLEQKGAKRR